MTALVVTVLLASLLGSLHCAGMCGAFVLFAIGAGDPRSPKSRTTLMAVYHIGRLVTYVSLGVFAGALGSALNLAGSLVGLQRLAAIGAGSLMIGYGLLTLLRVSGVRVKHLPVPTVFEELLVRGHGLAAGLSPIARASVTGFLTTLLPCGWLYAFVIVAAGTGSIASGIGVMATFWVGTLPALTALGIGVNRISQRLARRMPTIAAVCVAAAGLYTVVARAQISMPESRVHSGSPSSLVRDLRATNQKDLPCCTLPSVAVEKPAP